ncbi:MAG TPA: LysM peptidoglycan-binding domain-containing protein [Bacteroidales bacterium]|nr:LysM peptidoglycan-binding domain-containing protein [Bacteroidales bacterium]
MNKLFFFIAVVMVPLSLSSAGYQGIQSVNQPDTNTVFIIAPDDPITAMLDSLATLKIFQNISLRQSGQEIHRQFPADFVPVFSDSVTAARIQKMNDRSPIEFTFNAAVRAFIDLYASRRRAQTERMLGLAQLYFPLFEEQLDRHNLPLELKYLAVVESALNPTARSRVGATGLWQFMYHTGRMYGLRVTSFVDDRKDVRLSTVAAAEYLRDLYIIYNDWFLALAAYNAGPGNVNRAIRRAGGVKDFWKISPFLPRETRNYVPAFIAVAYVMEHAREHNLFAVPPVYSFLDVDTFHVHRELSLRTVSNKLDIPIDNLRHLNPAFRLNIIPRNQIRPYVLNLPREYSSLFMANEEIIYNFRSPEEIRQAELAAQMEETTVHVVRSGEVLGTIARRYGTTVGEIQRMNNLRGTLIRPGQRLIVRAPANRPVNIAARPNVHVVRSGETLGAIANRYQISLENIMAWNNLESSLIRVGQQLIVRPPAQPGTSN